jgi:AraC-like DNA-binding protein
MTELASGAGTSSEVCNAHFETLSGGRSPPEKKSARAEETATELRKCSTKFVAALSPGCYELDKHMTSALKPDSTEFYQDKDLAGLEVRRSFYCNNSFAPHTHDTVSLGAILAGAGYYAQKGSREVIATGNVIVIPPDEVHACNPQEGDSWGYLMFYISEGRLDEIARDLAGRRRNGINFPVKTFKDPTVFRRMLRLHGVVKEGESLLEKETALTDTVTALLLRHAELGPRRSPKDMEPRVVMLAKDYLAGNLEKNVSLKELSDLTGVGAYHLLHVFRKSVGMPPHAYHVQMRVSQARKLLQDGYSIVDSALETGFYDQSHFTKKFKRVVGLTPREYVLAHRLC